MAILVATKGFLIPAATSVAWKALSDVQHWKRWDRSIHQVELLESPKTGALGRISFKPHSSRILRITDVEAGRRMQWEFEGALGAWIHKCGIIDNAEGAIVTFEATYRGSWEPVVCRWMEKRLALRLEEQGIRFASVCKDISMKLEVHQQICQDLAKVA